MHNLLANLIQMIIMLKAALLFIWVIFLFIQFNFISVSLKSASKNGDSNIVEYLLKNGANLNINDTNGNTPLLSGTVKA